MTETKVLKDPDGNPVPVEDSDDVLPTVSTLDEISVSVTVQEGRVTMNDSGEDGTVTVSMYRRGLGADGEDTVASLLSELSFGTDVDDVYSETSLTLSDVQELHAALGDVIRYYGREPLTDNHSSLDRNENGGHHESHRRE